MSLRVDEQLDVVVASADPGDVQARQGETNSVTKFTITNAGNGAEAFKLTALATLGGDDFDPNSITIVLDTNGNGAYDAGLDTVYVAGSNDPLLDPDASLTVFLLSSMPTGADGQRGFVQLSAVAVSGSGAPGSFFAGQGEGGGDAVVGATRADGSAQGVYKLSSITVAFVKSASIADPFGGTKSVPGAIVTYTLRATVTGNGGVSSLALSDNIPSGTTYQAGSMTLDSAPLSDAADSDPGRFASGAIAVSLGTVAGGAEREVTFKVKIN